MKNKRLVNGSKNYIINFDLSLPKTKNQSMFYLDYYT